MKGVVFNLLEEVIREAYGEDSWDDLLEAARLEGVYTSLGTYSDEDLRKLVAAASISLEIPASDIIRWFGCQALPILAERYPDFFSAHTSTRAFLLTLNDIIHPEVRKLYPGADVPVFKFDTSIDNILIMSYASVRKLCAFAEGLIEGAAAYYSDAVTIERPQCQLRGDPQCVFRLTFRADEDKPHE